MNHLILLSTIARSALHWFESYLTGRSFRVSMGGEVSKEYQLFTRHLLRLLAKTSRFPWHSDSTACHHPAWFIKKHSLVTSWASRTIKTAQSCWFALNIRRIRPFQKEHAAQLLAQALVISRLDYCYALLAELPSCAIKLPQIIQNTVAYDWSSTSPKGTGTGTWTALALNLLCEVDKTHLLKFVFMWID